jgi:hypothetical protein
VVTWAAAPVFLAIGARQSPLATVTVPRQGPDPGPPRPAGVNGQQAQDPAAPGPLDGHADDRGSGRDEDVAAGLTGQRGHPLTQGDRGHAASAERAVQGLVASAARPRSDRRCGSLRCPCSVLRRRRDRRWIGTLISRRNALRRNAHPARSSSAPSRRYVRAPGCRIRRTLTLRNGRCPGLWSSPDGP